MVKTEGGVALLPLHDVERLVASGNVIRVYTSDDREYSIREPLASLFDKLSPHGFLRVHRGSVVRADAIVRVDKGRYRKAFAVLRSGARLEIGRLEFHRVRALWQPGVLDLDVLTQGLHLLSSLD